MNAHLIELSVSDGFETVGHGPMGRIVKVLFEDNVPSMPWMVVEQDVDGVKWTVLNTFGSLDDALILAMSTAHGDVTKFTVRLPDGSSFSRPGNKPAEQVLASFGWVFVTELIGFMMHKSGKAETSFEVRSDIQKQIDSQDVRLGEVHLSDENLLENHWCADLSLDYFGWVRSDEIEAEAMAAFNAEKVDVIPYFDYRARPHVSASTAVVIQFPMERIRKAA